MANAETTLEKDNNDQIEELDATQDEELLEADAEDDEGQETDGQDDDEGQEIVLEGDDGSHPKDEQHGIRKRINKLNAKVAVANQGKEQSAAELDIANERIRLLELAVDNQNAPVDGPPDPNDFDDGVTDAEYQKANNAFIAKSVRADVLKEQQTTQTQTEASGQLKARQIAHYQKADTLKVKDYDATEDAAIAILGQDVTNQVITASDKSPELLYYLGKNPEVAEKLSEELKTNVVKGVLRIGRLEARLVARPKAKNTAPDPDQELEGAVSVKTTATDRKLDKLRERAQSGNQKDITALMKFKKENRAKLSA